MRTFLILLALASVARADEETAKDHYQRGAALYDATRYESALHEFETAYTQTPSPELIYDIARCLDRLERREEAVAAYTRFLNADKSDDPQVNEVHVRLAEIGVAVQPKPSPPPLPAPQVIAVPALTALTPAPPVPPSRRRFLVPGLVGGGTVVFGAVGASLLGNALWNYNGLNRTCAPNCSGSSWSSLPGREHAGEALLGITGAAAVADIVLFVIAAKKKERK